MKTNKNVSRKGDSWKSLRNKIFTAEEMAETDIKVALLGEIIEARQKKGLTQKKLEKLSNIKQPMIARIEKGTADPRLSTLLRMLAASGKTLTISSLKKVS